MRCFVALPLAEELNGGLAAAAQEASSFGRMKKVEPENIHLTLKFLGEVEEGRVERVAAALDPLKKFSGFKVSLRGVGVFPKPEYVKVVWVGVGEGSEKVLKLHAGVEAALEPLKFKREKKFHPHFTLARVKGVEDKAGLQEYLDSHTETDFGSFTAEKIILMKSELTPQGPTYSPVREIKLKSP